MAITRNDPDTILLSPSLDKALIEDKTPAIEAITPGMLVELHNDSGTLKWGVHDTADDPCPRAVALDRPELNKGVGDAYAAADDVKVAHLAPGSTFWGLIPSGQNISPGDTLQSNGDGKLKAAATGDVSFVALESSGGAVTADTRLRTQVLR